MLEFVAILICIILIVFMIFLVLYDYGNYERLRKDKWAQSEDILCFFMALSLSFLTIGSIIDYENGLYLLPIFILILLMEFFWIIMMKSRNFCYSIFIGSFISGFVAIETILLSRKKNPELAWLTAPFLFFSLIQIALSDNIYKYNIDHSDLRELELSK